jgi:hypothetical protein
MISFLNTYNCDWIHTPNFKCKFLFLINFLEHNVNVKYFIAICTQLLPIDELILFKDKKMCVSLDFCLFLKVLTTNNLDDLQHYVNISICFL